MLVSQTAVVILCYHHVTMTMIGKRGKNRGILTGCSWGEKRYQSIQTQPHVPLCKKCRGILYTGPYVRSSKLRWMDGVQQVGHQTGDVPPISGSWNDWVDKSYKSIGRGCWSCLLCFFCPVGLCVSFMNNSMVSIIMKTQQYGGWVVKHTGGFLYRSTYKFVLFPIAIR